MVSEKAFGLLEVMETAQEMKNRTKL